MARRRGGKRRGGKTSVVSPFMAPMHKGGRKGKRGGKSRY